MRTHLLLGDSIRCYIGDIEILIEIERVPNLPVLAIAIGLNHAAHGKHFVPDGFIHFLLLDRSPVDALPVDGAVTGDGDVLEFGAIDECMTLLTTIAQRIGLLYVELLVRRTEDDSIICEVQIKVADEFDRSGEPLAIGNNEVSSPLFLKMFECIGKRFGIIRHAVSHSIEVGERNGVIRDDYRLYMLHSAGEVGIIVVVRVLRVSNTDN